MHLGVLSLLLLSGLAALATSSIVERAAEQLDRETMEKFRNGAQSRSYKKTNAR